MLRIISFTIHKHPLLGGKTFELTNPEENETDNYYSVIIGPNGTGKSYLLNNIIEALNEITLLKVDQNYKPKRKFTIDYLLEGIEYKISTENRDIIIEIDKLPASVIDIKLPDKWLACAVTINDKYPILNYIRKKQIPQYKYLGIRSASNNAFISRITINTVLYFIDSLIIGKSEKLLTVYKSLSLNPLLHIVFTGGPMLKLEKKEGLYSLYKNASKIIEPHNTFVKKNKSKTNYRADNYKKYILNEENLSQIYGFMLTKHSTFKKSSKSSMQIKYDINLSNSEGIKNLLDDWNVLKMMLELELIKISKFKITKNSTFNYEEASSGESHLLSTLHGILANIEDNSLVIIDEPEISLHPNWQIDYIEILKSLIDSYKGINVVISTHSHLLVTSLKNEESRITSIRRDKVTGELEIEELDYETYGWDPESILYNIFEVATIRNKYFETDLRKLISYVSTKSDNKIEIERLKDKIGKYVLPNEDDPLRLVIEQVENYLNNKNGLS